MEISGPKLSKLVCLTKEDIESMKVSATNIIKMISAKKPTVQMMHVTKDTQTVIDTS